MNRSRNDEPHTAVLILKPIQPLSPLLAAKTADSLTQFFLASDCDADFLRPNVLTVWGARAPLLRAVSQLHAGRVAGGSVGVVDATFCAGVWSPAPQSRRSVSVR